VQQWNPNQLRHMVATRIRKTFGIEDTAVHMGHKNIPTTEIYADKDMQRAMQIAREVG
jgi:integrase